MEKYHEMFIKINPARIKIEDHSDRVMESKREEYKNTFRAYGTNTGRIAIQTRTHAPLTRRARKAIDMLAHVELTKDEAKELIAVLNALITE